MTYDFDGNLTRKRLTASSSQFDQHLTWNPVGQLTQVATTRQGVTTTVGYGYDGLGRRVRTTNPDGSVTSVLYDGDDLLLELAGYGSVRAKYMYYPGIDYPHSVVRGTQTAYFATDQVGSVSALFDSVGQVLNRYTYEPFGEMETVSEQIVNSLRFTAREYDPATGLYYYRNRWYDPHLGRFISEDPIGLAGGINLLSYVANDPVNNNDPLGLFPRPRCPEGDIGRFLLAHGMCVYLLPTTWVEAERQFRDASSIGRGVNAGPRMPSGVTSFVDGVLSYPRGIFRFGRYEARRAGLLGECEQAKAAMENRLVQQAVQVAIDNPGATFDLAADYVSQNKARVAGRLGAGVLVTSTTNTVFGAALGLAAITGDSRHQAEHATSAASDILFAAIGGSTAETVQSLCGR